MAEKIFVTSNLTASIACPKCGEIEQKDVSDFYGSETLLELIYTCCCGHSFSVMLERRRASRRDVQLKGHLMKNYEKFPVLVENISNHGVRVKMLKTSALEDGQEIKIEFTLDDSEKSIIVKTARIKIFLSPTDIGCEFIHQDHHGSLENYLLN
ncbi:MAG: PilZ domain-containing protein [Desulfobacteraceae bacterium]|nr:PilZ domain-containing protein [Desulfobacteraceae bacterium]